MAFQTKLLFITLIILIIQVYGNKHVGTAALAHEIENELKITFPSLKHSAMYNMLEDLVNRVIPEDMKQLMDVIGSDIVTDQYSMCVKQHERDFIHIIVYEMLANVDVKLLSMIEENDLWEQELDQLKVILVLTVREKDILEESFNCIKTYEESISVFPINYGDLLVCFEELIIDEFDTKTDQINILWRIYERIDEHVGDIAELMARNIIGILQSVDALKKAIEECVQRMEDEEMAIITSGSFTKESVGKLYQSVYTKLKDYLDDLEEMVLKGRTEMVEKGLLLTSVSITNGVKTITSLRQDMIRLFNQTDLMGDDYQLCIDEQEETAVKIVKTAFENLESCSLVMDKGRHEFMLVLSSIKSQLNLKSESLISRLNDCVSEDYSPQGLLLSSACIKQFDKELENRNSHLTWETVAVEKMSLYQEKVNSCVNSAVEEAEDLKQELTNAIEQCVKDISREETHEEL